MKPFIAKIHYYPKGATGKGSAQGHVKYMVSPDKEEVYRQVGENGLFGDDIDHEPDFNKTIEELIKIQGEAPTWRVIMSLTAEDALELGDFEKREAWENSLRLSMPKVLKDLDMKDGKWVAAMHAKDGQPHVHMIMWDGAGKAGRQQELLSGRERELIKKQWMDEIYKDFFSKVGKDKAALRAQVLKMADRGVPQDRKKIGFEFIASRSLKRELAKRLEDLGAQLPKSGRIAFAYMPPDVKDGALELTDWLLCQPQFERLISEFQNQAVKFKEPVTSDPQILAQARQNAYEDIQKRVSNQLLRAAKDISNQIDQKESNSANSGFRGSRGLNNEPSGNYEALRQDHAGQVAQDVHQGIETLLKEQWDENLGKKLRPWRDDDWTLEKQ